MSLEQYAANQLEPRFPNFRIDTPEPTVVVELQDKATSIAVELRDGIRSAFPDTRVVINGLVILIDPANWDALFDSKASRNY